MCKIRLLLPISHIELQNFIECCFMYNSFIDGIVDTV